MPPFKYAAQLLALPDCPATDCEEVRRDGYRFVFRDRLAESFKPVLAMQPLRAIKWNDKDRCDGWALSFLASAEVAAVTFAKLQSTTRNVFKTLGDAIALGILETSDGVMSPPDDHGHFVLHEYADTNLTQRFSVVREMV